MLNENQDHLPQLYTDTRPRSLVRATIVRLTLRTLLAYLDDTLGATEIKKIGEKVSESESAQQLIERIKQVTRRRRLTTPPSSGPGAFDPNDVAEYLDNELENERIADIEKLCLESDVHLAEIAACHQILTLVLGEPVLVPPKSKERMYKLVTSRESIPFRKAAPIKKVNVDGLTEEEELELNASWMRWVLPVAGFLLVVALGLATYSIFPKPAPSNSSIAQTNQPQTEGGKALEPPFTPKDKETTPSTPPVQGKEPMGGGDTTTKPMPPVKENPAGANEKSNPPGQISLRNAAPNPKRAEIGSYLGGLTDVPTLLTKRTSEGWQAIAPGDSLNSADTLIALPGYISLVSSKGGVGLTLRGNLPSFSLNPRMNLLLESSVILHQNNDFDLDLTLNRGRIYLRNNKEQGPARIRLRFEKEVWDITLSLPSDEVGIDLFKEYSNPIDHFTEPPHLSLVLFMMRGDARLSVDAFHTHTLEAEGQQTMFLVWDDFDKSRLPQRIKMIPEFSKQLPSPDQFEGVRRTDLRESLTELKNLQKLIDGKRDKVAVALTETLDDKKLAARVAAIFGLASLDEPEKLVGVLGTEERERSLDRQVAVYALRHWLSSGVDQYKRLYDKEKGTGILLDRNYKNGEAKSVTDLLFDFSPEYFSKIETFEELARCLAHRRIAIAELGMWHLSRLAMGVKLPEGFNAARPVEDREKYAEKINDLINKRQLPPAPAPMNMPPKKE